jgi:hypothetical protein
MPNAYGPDWAAPYIRRGRSIGELPRFGDEAWRGLPSTDPRKIAAVCVAALAWADACDPERIRQELEDELACRCQAESAVEAEAWSRATSNVVSIATSRRRASWERVS